MARGNGPLNFVSPGFLLRVMHGRDVNGEELGSGKTTSWLLTTPKSHDRKGFSSLCLVLP